MNITLNKNGWYIHLNKFIFGEEIRFPSLCPQFWLTIFCIIASPIVAIFKAFKWLFKLTLIPIGKGIAYFVNKALCGPIYDKYIESASIDILQSGYEVEKNYKNYGWFDPKYELTDKSFKKYTIFQKWKEKIGNDWETYLNKLIEQDLVKQHLENLKVRENWLKIQERQAKITEIKSSPLIQNIVHYTSIVGKIIFWAINSLIIVLLGFLLIKLGIGIVHYYNTHWLNWKVFKEYLELIGFILLFLSIIVLLFLGIIKLTNCDPITKFFNRFFKLIGKGLLRLGIGIATPFYYLGKGFKILFVLIKENYCPIIHWEE